MKQLIDMSNYKKFYYDFCDKHKMIALRGVNRWSSMIAFTGVIVNQKIKEIYYLHPSSCSKCD